MLLSCCSLIPKNLFVFPVESKIEGVSSSSNKTGNVRVTIVAVGK